MSNASPHLHSELLNVSDLSPSVRSLKPSATLAINERSAALVEATSSIAIETFTSVSALIEYHAIDLIATWMAQDITSN